MNQRQTSINSIAFGLIYAYRTQWIEFHLILWSVIKAKCLRIDSHTHASYEKCFLVGYLSGTIAHTLGAVNWKRWPFGNLNSRYFGHKGWASSRIFDLAPNFDTAQSILSIFFSIFAKPKNCPNFIIETFKVCMSPLVRSRLKPYENLGTLSFGGQNVLKIILERVPYIFDEP